MNMYRKNKKGFTLVELVVVIAIVGVLAAILVPTMMNYIKKARLKAANGNAKLAFTTAKSAATMATSDGMDPHSFSIKSSVQGLASEGSGDYEQEVCQAVAKAMGDNGDDSGFVYIVMDEESYIGCAQWVANESANEIVGQYPDAPQTVKESQSISFGTKYTPGD